MSLGGGGEGEGEREREIIEDYFMDNFTEEYIASYYWIAK
jgi:hypothetical protein